MRVPSSVTRRVAAPAIVLALATLSMFAGTAAFADGPRPNDPPIPDVFPNVGDRSIDVLHYDIDMTYRSNTDISAVADIELQSATERSVIPLDLVGLTVDSVTVDGVAATWTRDVNPGAIKYKLNITPVAPVSGTINVRIAYSGSPQSFRDPDNSTEGWMRTPDGVTALGQPIGNMTWFPSNNVVSDKATYSLAVNAPAGESVAGAGFLTSRTVQTDGTTTWQWDVGTKTSTSLMALSVGDFDVLESTIDLGGGRTIPEWSFVDSSLSQSEKDAIDAQRARTAEVLNWLQSKLGPYPGSSTGLIVDPGSAANYALETQERPFYPGVPDPNTFVHELVHQWLGNEVSPQDWSQIWLNEATASFYPEYFDIDSEGASGRPEDIGYSTWSTLPADADEWDLPATGQTTGGNLYGWQTYERGRIALGALMTAIDREDFDRTMMLWVERFGGGAANTSDLQALAEEVSGLDLDAFFAEWIYSGGKPAAWPAEWTLDVSSPADGRDLAVGDEIAMTVDVENIGKSVLSGATVRLGPVSALRVDGALPTGVSIVDDVVVWTVPDTAVGASQSVTVRFVIRPDAAGRDLRIDLTTSALGARTTDGTIELTVAGPTLARTGTSVGAELAIGGLVIALLGVGVVLGRSRLRRG